MTRSIIKLELASVALVCATILCQARLPITSYKRELTLNNVEILLSKQPTTRRGSSLVYAACQQMPEYFFRRMQCNVSVEAPLFVKSAENHTCPVYLFPDSPMEKLTELRLHAMNDRRALLSWSVAHPTNSWRTKVRILSMDNCDFVDVSVPVRNFAHVIAHKSGFDVLIKYHGFCKFPGYCKVSYDANGNKLSGPTRILYDSDGAGAVVIPTVQPFLEEGYLLAGVSPRGYIVKVEPDGKLKPLMAISIPRDRTLRATYSSLCGFYSLCVFVNGTSVTCHLYDPQASFRMSATLQFDERESNDTRWIAIRNWRARSLVLATGRVSQSGRNADDFSVLRLHSDGRWSKPMKIQGIDFKGVDEFHTRLSKNKLDELCFHFIGKQSKSYQLGTINRLKLAIKCLSKAFINAENLLVVN